MRDRRKTVQEFPGKPQVLSRVVTGIVLTVLDMKIAHRVQVSASKGTRIMRTNRSFAVIGGTAVLALTLGLGSATAALAATNDTNTTQSQSQHTGNGPLHALVTAGTITDVQAQAIHTALKSAHEANKGSFESTLSATKSSVLSTLVSNGTVTQAQADAISGAARGGVKDLVTAGTITKDQAKAYGSAMRAAMTSVARPDRAATVKSVLDSLVSAGTISAAQESAVIAAIPAQAPGQHNHAVHIGGFGHHRQASPAPSASN